MGGTGTAAAGRSNLSHCRNTGDDSGDAGVDVVDDTGPSATASAGRDGQDAGEGGAGSDGAGASPSVASGGTWTTIAGRAASDSVSGPAPSSAAAGETSTGGGGIAKRTLVGWGPPVLPVLVGGLATLVGQSVTGTGMQVNSVVADEDAWVGSSPTGRILATPPKDPSSGSVNAPSNP